MMKELIKITAFLCSCLFGLTMCASKEVHHEEPDIVKPVLDGKYDWERERKSIPTSSDMVLLYGGGQHRRPFTWDKERLEPYVVYKDEEGREHWMFDSFLMIEFMDYNCQFITGFHKPSARKEDWMRLANYYFSKDEQLGALDKLIGEVMQRLGKPAYKHRIVIAMPEPIRNADADEDSSETLYWGADKSGKRLDFANDEDRVAACRWYVDYVRKKFNEMKYKNLELGGFYWVAETAQHSSTILKKVSNYINKYKYSFNWIPYFRAPGYKDWKSYGYHFAYHQPNYFFYDVPLSRLDQACEDAKLYGMDLEFEFDNRAMSYLDDADRSFSKKMNAYMEAFKRNGVWQNKRLAYYEGGNAVYQFSVSHDVYDQILYHKFCHFVVDRPYRTIEGKKD